MYKKRMKYRKIREEKMGDKMRRMQKEETINKLRFNIWCVESRHI